MPRGKKFTAEQIIGKLREAEGVKAVFVVEPEVELRESVGFNVREFSGAEDLIDDHLELIKQKCAEHLR